MFFHFSITHEKFTGSATGVYKMEANFMGNDAVDCVRKEGGCNTQTDMISRLVLFPWPNSPALDR